MGGVDTRPSPTSEVCSDARVFIGGGDAGAGRAGAFGKPSGTRKASDPAAGESTCRSALLGLAWSCCHNSAVSQTGAIPATVKRRLNARGTKVTGSQQFRGRPRMPRWLWSAISHCESQVPVEADWLNMDPERTRWEMGSLRSAAGQASSSHLSHQRRSGSPLTSRPPCALAGGLHGWVRGHQYHTLQPEVRGPPGQPQGRGPLHPAPRAEGDQRCRAGLIFSAGSHWTRGGM